MKHKPDFLIDMVHHNPGEPPFKTEFLNPSKLVNYGYNGQVFKHINCIVTFSALNKEIVPDNSPDRAWIDSFSKGIYKEIAAAKSQGLSVFYHLDLFVLPKRLVELYRDEICDEKTGRISLFKPKTLEIHKVMFDELCNRFPEVDGYIIRVGETYLYDTPYHAGNGPIPNNGPRWSPTYLYDKALSGEELSSGYYWTDEQTDAYIKMISFLRDEVCVKHNKHLIFRTWDIFPDKLHSVKEHYLKVTDRIEPHDKLLFSIKHTALDFWRHIKSNPSLTVGKHPQIIEVQCQREYEGKGAYPNYVMNGIIDGFEENREKIGLKSILKNPLIKGIYTWSRGGGWYGPYIKDEFWCDLNTYVISHYANNIELTEEEIFRNFCHDRLNLNEKDAELFRSICLLSARAVLKGRHCEPFDRNLQESLLPTANWMRDDRLGGLDQLKEIFEYLFANNLFDEALKEKRETIELWREIREIFGKISFSNQSLRDFIGVSIEYGLNLFQVIYHGWRVMIEGFKGDKLGTYDLKELQDAIKSYDEAWNSYRALESSPYCSSLYHGRYFNMPQDPPTAGMDESVNKYKKILEDTVGADAKILNRLESIKKED
jgi:hypothetical protein